MDSILVLKGVFASYIACTVAILVVKGFTPLNSLLLYGKNVGLKRPARGGLRNLVNSVFALTVPKSYFAHFYYLLFAYCAIIQAASFLPRSGNNPTAYKNIKIIHYLLWVQGLRRSYECLYVSKFSPTSPINILHYLVGVGHYTLVSIACASSLVLTAPSLALAWVSHTTALDWTLVAVFLVVSFRQYTYHAHLASLKKYSLPAFSTVSSPHYWCEIQLYAVLFVFAATAGVTRWVPLCFAACLVFVLVNLSISSLDTHRYYKAKYPEFTLRYAIVPGIL